MTCEHCGAAPPDGWTLCHGCVRTLDETLAAIGRAHRLLDPRPARRGGGRGAPGFRSTPPADLNVIALTDPRTTITAEEGWTGATVNVLAGWGPTGATVDDLVTGLRGSLDTLAARPWAADLLDTTTRQLRRLRLVIGDLDPQVVIGGCPVVDADDHDEARTCGGRIRASAFGEPAVCGRCGWRWTGPVEWMQLARSLGPAEMDAADLARYFGHDTPSTVRTWAWRDGWPRRRAGGRTLYPLQSAVASWAARQHSRRVSAPGPAVAEPQDRAGSDTQVRPGHPEHEP